MYTARACGFGEGEKLGRYLQSPTLRGLGLFSLYHLVAAVKDAASASALEGGESRGELPELQTVSECFYLEMTHVISVHI